MNDFKPPIFSTSRSTIFTISNPRAGNIHPLMPNTVSEFISQETESYLTPFKTDRPVSTSFVQTEEEAKLKNGSSSFTSKGPPVGDRVVFAVGEARQTMCGQRSKMAALSDVFAVMLKDRWKDAAPWIDIPDVTPQAMSSLIMFSEGDHDSVQLTDRGVWEVLKAADKYHVLPLIHQCFRFLLYRHSACRQARHLCVVLELAHRLHQTDHHHAAFGTALNYAGKIFRDKQCLRELCYDCMLAFLKQDSLTGVDEVLALEAVMTWARQACARKGVTSECRWEELRAAAGELVHHVRYLTMPRSTLIHVLHGHPSCLLTSEERADLMNQHTSMRPENVHCERRTREDQVSEPETKRTGRRCVRLFIEVTLCILILFLVVFLLMFMLR